MLNPKTSLLLVIIMTCSMTLTGCAGISGIFSGLLDGVMASFGDLFTAEGFTGFLGNVLGSAAQELGPQLANGNMDSGDIWGSIGNAALGELGDRAKGTDWKGIAKDGWDNRNAAPENKETQEQNATVDVEKSSATDSSKTPGSTDDGAGATGSNATSTTK